MTWTEAFTDKLERVKHALPWKAVSKEHGKLHKRGRDVPVRHAERRTEPVSERPLLEALVSVYENERELLVVADVPGCSPECIRVDCDGQELIFLAEPESCVDHGRGGILKENPPGCYQRRFDLPGQFDGARARANVKDGVLTVSVPRRADGSRRRIPVGSG